MKCHYNQRHAINFDLLNYLISTPASYGTCLWASQCNSTQEKETHSRRSSLNFSFTDPKFNHKNDALIQNFTWRSTFLVFPAHCNSVQQVTRARGAQANDVGPKLPKAKAAEALNSRLLSHIWQAATAQLIKAGTIVLHSGKSRVFKSLQSTYLRQRMNRK